MANRGS